MRVHHGKIRHHHSRPARSRPRRTSFPAISASATDAIAALGHDLGTADQFIDATGRLVPPGGIDSHVHISQPSAPMSSWRMTLGERNAIGCNSAAIQHSRVVSPPSARGDSAAYDQWHSLLRTASPPCTPCAGTTDSAQSLMLAQKLMPYSPCTQPGAGSMDKGSRITRVPPIM